MSIHPLIVLIATSGRTELFEKTLQSLDKCVKPKNYSKTIIVENGTKGNVEEIVGRYKNSLKIEYEYISLANKSSALNYALEDIPDDTLVFFTDDDIKLDINILKAYSAEAKNVERGTFFGGYMTPLYEKQLPQWMLPSMPPSVKGYKYDKQNFRQSLFLGCNWAAFAGDIKKVGGFDPNFGPGTIPKRMGQETNMQHRLLDAGFKHHYIDKAKVWHVVPKEKSTLTWLLKRKFQAGISREINFATKSKKRTIPFLLIKELLENSLYLTVKIFSSKEKILAAFCKVIVSLGKLKGYYIRLPTEKRTEVEKRANESTNS